MRYGYLEVIRIHLRESRAARNSESDEVESCDHGGDYGECHQRP